MVIERLMAGIIAVGFGCIAIMLISRTVRTNGFSNALTARRLFITSILLLLICLALAFISFAARAGAVGGSGVPGNARLILDGMLLVSEYLFYGALLITITALLKRSSEKRSPR